MQRIQSRSRRQSQRDMVFLRSFRHLLRQCQNRQTDNESLSSCCGIRIAFLYFQQDSFRNEQGKAGPGPFPPVVSDLLMSRDDQVSTRFCCEVARDCRFKVQGRVAHVTKPGPSQSTTSRNAGQCGGRSGDQRDQRRLSSRRPANPRREQVSDQAYRSACPGRAADDRGRGGGRHLRRAGGRRAARRLGAPRQVLVQLFEALYGIAPCCSSTWPITR